MTVTSERPIMELALEEDTSNLSSINVNSFVDEQEWRLHTHVETFKRVATKAYNNPRAKYPALSAACQASRRPGFFVWNIILVMVCPTVLDFLTIMDLRVSFLSEFHKLLTKYGPKMLEIRTIYSLYK